MRLFRIIRGFLASQFPCEDGFSVFGMRASGRLHYRVPPVLVPSTGRKIWIPEEFSKDVQTVLFQEFRGQPFTWLTAQTYILTCYRQLYARADNRVYPPVYAETVFYDPCPNIRQERTLCPCPLSFPECNGVVKFEDNEVCIHY